MNEKFLIPTWDEFVKCYSIETRKFIIEEADFELVVSVHAGYSNILLPHLSLLTREVVGSYLVDTEHMPTECHLQSDNCRYD